MEIVVVYCFEARVFEWSGLEGVLLVFSKFKCFEGFFLVFSKCFLGGVVFCSVFLCFLKVFCFVGGSLLKHPEVAESLYVLRG